MLCARQKRSKRGKNSLELDKAGNSHFLYRRIYAPVLYLPTTASFLLLFHIKTFIFPSLQAHCHHDY